ncbi:probable G-protein coupled receptor No9 [Lytechinus variegatus]|uniref:probable G-protein coupled receptor No9 n=1 Tax=Lytechinus variegatus TaxID=7654 RepID=UPI001BB0FE31|nr:probable G-protein coupled receptor No9 [Lytechinus variegatus]XP_041477297.1 probable G-protein coupled receptor No9 [Lytechinus variegatus]
MNNTSDVGPQQLYGLYSPAQRYATAVLYSICTILIVVCNGFTLYILQTCHDAFQETTRLFFKALAIVDMCGGLFGACLDFNFLFSVTKISMIDGPFCTFLPTIYYTIFNQTLAILCCVNLDRLLTIVWPLRYPILVTTRHAKIALFFALVIPLLFTVMVWPVPGFPSTETLRIVCGLNGSVGQWNDWVNADIERNIWKFSSFGLILVPAAITIIITTISNLSLIFISWRHIRKTSFRISNEQQVNRQRISQDITKGVRTVLVITFSCYAALGIWCFTIMYVYPRLGQPGFTVTFIISVVVELSTRWWNCLVYLSTSQTFREHSKKAIKRLCCRANAFRC